MVRRELISVGGPDLVIEMAGAGMVGSIKVNRL